MPAAARASAPAAAPTPITDVVRVQDWHDVHVGSAPDRAERLAAVVRERAADLGLSAALASGLRLHGTRKLAHARGGFEIVEVHGRFAGVPLLGPVARMLVDGRGRVRTMVAGGPVGALTNPVARLSADDARTAVAASGLPGASERGRTRLVALPGPVHTRLVWLVEAPLDRRGVTRPVFAVDAELGAVRVLHDRVRTTDVRSFERNPVVDPAAGIFDLVEDSTATDQLLGTHFQAQNCIGDAGDGTCDGAPSVVANAAGDFLYDAPDVTNPGDNTQMGDPFAEVSIYYHTDKFFAWLQGHGFDGLDCHDDSGRAVLVANFHWVDAGNQTPYDNAFYSGDCSATMVFGQGSEVDFAYDGDVVYHELGHGVVDRLMGDQELGWERRRPDGLVSDAGAMNEGFADFFSSTFAGDPIVGDYIGAYWTTIEGSGLRDNANDFVCPDHLVGEVHIDSEPFAAMLWATQQQYGEAVVPAAFDTIDLLDGNATLEEGTAVFRNVVAAQLGGGAGTFVDDVAQSRGLVDCLRATSPDTLRGSLWIHSGGYYTPYVPPAMQLRLDVPEGADAVTLDFSLQTWGVEPVVGVLMRRDAAVEFGYQQTPDEMLVTATYDAEQLGLGGGPVDLEVGAAQTLYVAFVNQANNTLRVNDIAVQWHGASGETGSDDEGTGNVDDTGDGTATSAGDDAATADGTTEGGGADDQPDDGDGDEADDGDENESSSDGDVPQDGDGGGCGCRTDTPRLAPALLGLLGLALARRRRR